jgi:hypothetical protein
MMVMIAKPARIENTPIAAFAPPGNVVETCPVLFELLINTEVVARGTMDVRV